MNPTNDSNSTAGNAPAFTPGPWQFIETGTENAAVRISQDCVVSGSYNGGDSDLLSHANARLIAAAPELLALLRECLDPASKPDLADRMRAAIAKAEGRS